MFATLALEQQQSVCRKGAKRSCMQLVFHALHQQTLYLFPYTPEQPSSSHTSPVLLAFSNYVLSTLHLDYCKSLLNSLPVLILSPSTPQSPAYCACHLLKGNAKLIKPQCKHVTGSLAVPSNALSSLPGYPATEADFVPRVVTVPPTQLCLCSHA